MLVSYRPLALRFAQLQLRALVLNANSDSWSSWLRETQPKTSLCIIQQRLTDDHNSTNELQPILLNFLLPYCLVRDRLTTLTLITKRSYLEITMRRLAQLCVVATAHSARLVYTTPGSAERLVEPLLSMGT